MGVPPIRPPFKNLIESLYDRIKILYACIHIMVFCDRQKPSC